MRQWINMVAMLATAWTAGAADLLSLPVAWATNDPATIKVYYPAPDLAGAQCEVAALTVVVNGVTNIAVNLAVQVDLNDGRLGVVVPSMVGSNWVSVVGRDGAGGYLPATLVSTNFAVVVSRIFAVQARPGAFDMWTLTPGLVTNWLGRFTNATATNVLLRFTNNASQAWYYASNYQALP